MKQQLKTVKTSDFDIRFYNYPEKHIREYLEFPTNSEAFEYMKIHDGYRLSGWTKELTFKITKDYYIEPDFINIAKIRLNYCQEHKVYTICACCGAELHEHQKENHTITQWGIIGPECIKKLIIAGIPL